MYYAYYIYVHNIIISLFVYNLYPNTNKTRTINIMSSLKQAEAFYSGLELVGSTYQFILPILSMTITIYLDIS